MSGVEYVLDSSCLIKLHRDQPIDIYVSLWSSLADLLADGRAVIPREAFREIERRDDELRRWLHQRESQVVEASSDELVVVSTIAAAHPGWVAGRRNAADPFVIAAARQQRAVVVTDERRSGRGADDRNVRLPTVAAEFGVQCISLTEMVRRCGWVF